ncbi:MAG: phosphodiester glycosidase family protein [Thermodesulfobacteriota bacterium]
MTARVFALVVVGWLGLGAVLSAGAAGLTHTPPQWQEIGRGLTFTQVHVLRDGVLVDDLAVVKIDPASNAFRVFHGAPQAITVWQEKLQAPIVFNGSYYRRDGTPCGLVIADGKPIGPTHNRQMRGMFVAEPKGMSPDLPRATILDLLTTPVDPKKLPWTQGVQSFPLLLDYKGKIRIKNSDKRSHRTVIATDRIGNILVFNSSKRFFTLFEFANFLKSSQFSIDSALNLDGGTEAQLYIKTKSLDYYSPPSWENSLGNLIDEQKYWLPTVIGVFPRQE